jgi:radical SAM superfamily enzyme YgiQ (UPF0313 family)
MPLLGPVYLGTILRDKGHEVEIYNEDIRKPDYENLTADVIGISLLTSTARRGYEIAGKFPREKVILGGVHASLLPDEAIRYGRQVVVGEAESVIADVIEGKNKEPIVYGRPVENLDELPQPDFSLVRGFNSRSEFLPISTSRGCPFACNFCSVTRIFGRKYRFRSAESVMSELLSRRAASYFFCDDNFAANPGRTRTLLDRMLKHKMRDWICQVRCEVAKDAELVSLMAKAGCSVVCVGFESVNAKTLHAYQKNQTVDEIVHAIRSFRKKNIRIHGMFVLGSDEDSGRTVWETLRFAVRQRIDTVQMSVLTPFPGTKIYEMLERQKRIFTKDWSLYDGLHVVFHPNGLSAKELQQSVIKAYSKFYNLSRSMSMLLRLRFRNAMFNFMGYSLVRKWNAQNRKMSWLLENQPGRPALSPPV